MLESKPSRSSLHFVLSISLVLCTRTCQALKSKKVQTTTNRRVLVESARSISHSLPIFHRTPGHVLSEACSPQSSKQSPNHRLAGKGALASVEDIATAVDAALGRVSQTNCAILPDTWLVSSLGMMSNSLRLGSSRDG